MSVDRSDLEGKLRQIENIVEESKSQAQTTGTAIAIGAVVLVILVFLLGRRRGKVAGGARVEVFKLK